MEKNDSTIHPYQKLINALRDRGVKITICAKPSYLTQVNQPIR